ncbi:MAG: hypothetical protein IMZ66_00960, partial [Planctomycetes bacterium]|nr:hypothetical protein [Planctomycetota bacterium]
MPNAVLALTAGPEPTRAQVGGAVLWRGVTSLAGSYTNLGDNGSTSIYQGVIFDNAWTDAGNFSGTLGEASGASGFEVILNRDVALQSAILKAGTGATHEVAFSGPGRLTLGTGAFGGGTTAQVYAHRGVPAMTDDPGTTGLATVTANVAGILRSGMSLRIENGVFSQGGTITTAIATGATVDVGVDGVFLGNHTTGQVNLLSGGLMRLGATGWAAPARTAFSNGAGLYLDFDALNWDTEQLPKDKALDLLVANDGSFPAGLYLGQGARLMVVPGAAGAGSLTINAGATGIVKTTGGLPVTDAQIATPTGTTATFTSAVQMSGVNLTLGSLSLMMPSGAGGTAADFARRPADMGGSLLFGGSFRAGSAVVAAGSLYTTSADFNVLGDLDVAGPASVLYLGGGGAINAVAHGEQTARLTSTTGLAEDRVAGRIVLRDTTRLEMGLLDSAPRDPVTGRVHVTQPIVIAGTVNPADKRSIWVSRREGTVVMPVTLADLTLAPGGVFAVDDSDTTNIRANFKVAGASTVALYDNFDVLDMVRDLSSLPPYDGTNPVVVNWGRTDEAGVLVSSIYGSIGAGVRIDMIHGSLYFQNGSRLDGVVDTSTAPAGGDSYVLVYAGRGGVPANRLAGTGTVRLGRTPVGAGAVVGPEDIGLVIDEVAAGVTPLLNVLTQTIRVVDDGTTAVDGIARTDRGVDNAVNGYGRYTHVEIEQGATLTVQSWNEQNVVADFQLVAPSATVDQTGTDATRVYLGSITGTGSEELILAGDSNTSLIGALTNATLTLTNTATTTLADQTASVLGAGNRFSASGSTINAQAGLLDFGVIGASGTGGLGAGLTIHLGSGGALKGRVDEVAVGLPAILATHAPTIRVATTGRLLFEKNVSTTANNGTAYFPNVRMADGAHLAVNQGIDSPSGLFGLTLEGSGSFASENSDNVWLGNVTGSGGTLSWLRHPADATARTLKLVGTLNGADVQLDSLNTTWQLTSLAVGTYAGSFQLGGRTLTLTNGNSLDLYVAPGAGLIDSVTTPGGPPINIYKGADGAAGLTADTRIRLADGNTLRAFAQEVGAGAQIVNHVYAHVDIATTARLEGNRSNDATFDGFPFFHNVNLAPGARVDLNRIDGSLVASLNLEADGYASNVSTGPTIFIADVTGTGATPASLTIDGITDMGLVGTLSNADVHLATTNTTYLLDMTPTGLGRKFDLGGRTLYAEAGTLQVGGTKPGWGSMAAPNPNLDPGTGTIDQTAGLVVIHSGQDGSKGAAGWGDGVTIAKNADTLTTLRINETGPYNLPLQNVFNGRVDVNVTSTLAADRNVDLQTPGTGYFTNVHLPDAMTVRLQSINDQNIAADIVLDGATGFVQNDSSSTRVFLGDASGAGTLILVGGQVTHAVGDLATDGVRVGNPAAAGSLTLDPTATVNLTSGFEVTSTGTLRVNAPVGGDYTVRAGGLLIIGDAGFTGAVTKDSGAQIGLAQNASYTENDPGTTLLIAVPEYSGLLTLMQNDTQIGAIVTDQAGIVSTLAGTATQVNFGGGTHLLHLGKDGLATPVVTAGRHVNVNRNVVFHSANDYTGGTTIGGGKATVLDPGALGSGAVTVAGGELEIRPAGFTAGPVAVTGGTLDLYADFTPALTLGGGTVEAHGNVQATGALSDAGNLTLRASAGDTLTFTGGLALNGGRQWNVDAGTVEFLGNVSGAQSLTKLGAGRLELAGAALNALTVGDGFAAGGTVVVASDTALPGTGMVLINAQSAYGVGADHDYIEVDLLNSAGCLALGADTSAGLAMENEFMTLGASADAVYTGMLTPYDDLVNPIVYRLGGGGARLTMQTEMTNGAVATDVQIGRNAPGVGDITHQGEVLLDSSTGNSFTGFLDVYGYAGITSWDQVSNAEAVRVHAGGSLDLGGLAVPEVYNVDLSGGGGVSSNGHTLTSIDLERVFTGATEVVLGGGMFDDGVTTVEDGALYYWDLRKIGPNELVLADPGAPSANSGVTLVAVEDGTLTV